MRQINRNSEFRNGKFELQLTDFIVSCWLADCELGETKGMIIQTFGVIIPESELNYVFCELDGMSWGNRSERRN